MSKKLLITLPEYERIFRVIHTVLRSTDTRSAPSCLFYNTVGAFMLEQALKVKARPLMGAAFIRLHDPTASVAAFAVLHEDGSCEGSQERFHCWVDTPTHVIDFTAPVYQQYADEANMQVKVPSKMFQRRKEEMAPSHHELFREGDFYMQPNLKLTQALMERGTGSVATGDLANVCMTWFRRPPKPIEPTMGMVNTEGME